MTARLSLTALAAGALVFVAACGGTTSGTARPAAEPTETGSSATSAPTTASSAAGVALSGVDPCSLVATKEAGDLGAVNPKRQTVGTADTCQWRIGDTGFSIAVRTNLGLEEVQASGGQITEIKVGDRPAKQVSGRSSGGCMVTLGVTSSSRVDVLSIPVAGGDGCPLALQVAGMVEPKLP
ncbi:DUF3558 family protein [Lentzea sp. NBRC 102530]|uniref:DUF3558 family protein n=1 Tax=Lentzea sp. NBRC 102530 TaxID=3032201 RepID=UPI00249FA2CC|nr:DUF3558 family protein [Lentzea sp. NBRC 102530]GLY52615.1 hypothetical protein Lesp01_62710 [Lentzea sp. NBRC 102530]